MTPQFATSYELRSTFKTFGWRERDCCQWLTLRCARIWRKSKDSSDSTRKEKDFLARSPGQIPKSNREIDGNRKLLDDKCYRSPFDCVAVHLDVFVCKFSICSSPSVCLQSAMSVCDLKLFAIGRSEPRDQRDIGDHQTPSEHHATLSQMMPLFFAFCNCFCILLLFSFFLFEIAQKNCHRRKLALPQKRPIACHLISLENYSHCH